MAVAALFFEAFFHLMSLGFISNSGDQGLPYFIIITSTAQDRAKIGFLVVEQAGPEFSL